MSEEKKQQEQEESFISHLEAFREALIKCLISLCVTLPVGLIVAPKGLNFLTAYLIGKNKFQFNYFSPTEVFVLQVKMAVLVAFILAFPYIVKKLWEFIVPALYDNEKKFIKSTVLLSFFLVCFG